MKREQSLRTLGSPTALMVIAGLLYSSWPLGYWLNPSTNKGLASDLEALHQPYRWLFISMDVGCGLLVAIATTALLIKVRRGAVGKRAVELWLAGIGALIFGLFTALDALLPLNCIQGEANCVITIKNPSFVVHGIFSIGSIFGLTMSIFAILILLLRKRRAVRKAIHLTPVLFLAIWIGFGVLTLHLILNNQSSALSQHIFIEFCALWLIALPYFVNVGLTL